MLATFVTYESAIGLRTLCKRRSKTGAGAEGRVAVQKRSTL